jgi:hypothetical protein
MQRKYGVTKLDIGKETAEVSVTVPIAALRDMYAKELKAGHPVRLIENDLKRRVLARAIASLGESAKVIDLSEHELTPEKRAAVPETKIEA